VRIDPADAAVAVRSFPRRWREVLASDRADAIRPQLDTLALDLSDALHRAGHAMGLHLSVDLDPAASELATAIESAGPDRWRNDAVVEVLSAGIDEAAAAIRGAERLVEDSD
jgi:hypothetical protein